MEISARIRLIQELRTQLLTLDWEDRDLVLHSFGFSSREDNQTISEFLAKNDDVQLLALSNHFSLSNPVGSFSTDSPTAASTRLLMFASHLSTEQALVGAVAYELSSFGITLFVAHQTIDPNKV